ncbi:hypothetical protein [Halobacillus sp. Cin3]|uniref:hypothetical protein n=1 Tax=Halobacillus sp. Cin3 TaxID=2928441 RepID=UPI0032B25337
MKRFGPMLIVFLTLFLVACSSTESSGNQGEESNKEDSGSTEVTVDSVLEAFQEANLEAEKPTEMKADDFGMAPMKSDEAKRFLIPSLGADSGGRIFSFENKDDLEEMKSYYDDLGKESAMLYSHTAAREDILIQVNGELEGEEFNKYKEVLNAVGSGSIPKFEKQIEITFQEAQENDAVKDDYGTYEIVNTSKPEQSEFKSGPLKFTVNKVLLARFKPNQDSKSFFDQENLNLAIALINSENTSEDTVSFHPFSAKVTTNTKGQYGAQDMLNKGESEHIGQVKQEFIIPYNLEDEDLSQIEDLTFYFDGIAKDASTVGEDVEVPVTFE